MRDGDASDFSDLLLAWYDRHARTMPWRVPPEERKAGVKPDPYRVWLSEVMLQQTTVAAVRDYFRRFTDRWPTVADLAAADDSAVMGEWAGLGYYARARNLLACARAVVRDHGGAFPTTREGLLTLPGIGPYTASAIAAIAHDEAATVVDGNVERVMARLWRVEEPLPGAKAALTRLAERLTPMVRPGDYAQAVMDLGATICTPRNPACGICPWRGRMGCRRPCHARRRRRPSRCGRERSGSRGAMTAHGWWNGGRIAACWAGCWDFRVLTGMAVAERNPWQRNGRKWARFGLPSRIST